MNTPPCTQPSARPGQLLGDKQQQSKSPQRTASPRANTNSSFQRETLSLRPQALRMCPDCAGGRAVTPFLVNVKSCVYLQPVPRGGGKPRPQEGQAQG